MNDSGWIANSAWGKRRKIGNMVIICFNAFAVSATRTWHRITTLPDDWLPADDNISVAIVGGDYRQYTAVGMVDVTNKDFRIYANTATNYWGCIAYFAG